MDTSTFPDTLQPDISCLAEEQDTVGTLAVTAQAPALAWGRWADNPSQPDCYMMDISGLIQPQQYGPRRVPTTAMARANITAQYVNNIPFTNATPTGIIAQNHHQQQHQQNLYNTTQYTASAPDTTSGQNDGNGNGFIDHVHTQFLDRAANQPRKRTLMELEFQSCVHGN